MKTGFTLAELLIVIGIISLLTVSISPLMRGNQDQALLSRQSDLMRQSFYETVMKAKTGAVDSVAEGLPLRGFFVSERDQQIEAVTFTGLNFTDAKKKGLNALKSDMQRGANLLSVDIGKSASKPLATLKLLSLDGRQSGEMLLLFEPVSNDVALITEAGVTPVSKSVDITIAHADSPNMTRHLAITPGTSTITETQ